MKSKKPILLSKDLLSKTSTSNDTLVMNIKEPVNLENVHESVKIVKKIYIHCVTN